MEKRERVMAVSQRLRHLLIGVVLGVVIAGGGIGVAAAVNGTRLHAYHGLIRGCINLQTRGIVIRGGCGRGTKAIAWNGRGPRGVRGTRGTRGPRGQVGPAGGATAWGEITPDPTTKQIFIQNGSKNVLNAFYNAPGNYTVIVGDCAADSDHAVSVLVQAGQDSLAENGAALGNVTDPVTALVPTWSYIGGQEIEGQTWPAYSMYFDVDVYDLKTAGGTDADVSFAVNC